MNYYCLQMLVQHTMIFLYESCDFACQADISEAQNRMMVDVAPSEYLAKREAAIINELLSNLHMV